MTTPPFASYQQVLIASGTNASETIRLPRADHVALLVPAIASGSAHNFNVQGAIVLGRDAPSSAQFVNIVRNSGSLMAFATTAVAAGAPYMQTLSPDVAPYDALRVVCQSFQLAPLTLTVISKAR